MNPSSMISSKLVYQVTKPKNIKKLKQWWDPKNYRAMEVREEEAKVMEPGESPGEFLLDQEEPQQHVPKGFLAVYVGQEQRRFVIPMSCLSMPDFSGLMERAAEEFGFEQEGGLRIPCQEEHFEEILNKCLREKKLMSKSKKNK